MEKIDIYRQAIKPYISGEAKTCSYCDCIKPLVIYYGESFYITAAIGSYMIGYIQLCSYEHRTSATGILRSEYDEFEKMLLAIRKCFKKVYGNYGICFEHGQAGTCCWTENHVNSLCHHMHIHCLPVSIDIHPAIESRFPDYYEVCDVQHMIQIRKDILNGGPYLFFSSADNRKYMYNVVNQNVPRQFLRRCVAEKLEIADKADWIKYPGVEYYEETINMFKDVLKRELEE